ncbi:MAG: RsmD family RNA methyltransferase [Longimicrobiales bacterium]
MRIIEGIWKDTDLVSPGRRVRPTAEPVRDAWLTLLADRLDGAVVVDLFAGTGALALEALSRGAAHADFVENGAEALHSLKANVAKLRLRQPERGWQPTARGGGASRWSTVRVFKRDAIPFAEALEKGIYDIAFADAPYGSAKLDRIVAAWHAVRFATVLGVEHGIDHELPPGGRRLDFEDTAVTVYGLGGKKRRSRGRKRRGGGGSGSGASPAAS